MKLEQGINSDDSPQIDCILMYHSFPVWAVGQWRIWGVAGGGGGGWGPATGLICVACRCDDLF